VGREPEVVRRLGEKWDLVITDEDPLFGAFALVVPALRGAEPCVLKLSWLREAVAAEAVALSTWNGNGAVRLLASEPESGALLLERLNSRITLQSLPLLDAARTAGGLLRSLAIIAPPGVPTLRSVAARIGSTLPARHQRLGNPVPGPWLDLASELVGALGQRPTLGVLVHADLHYGNVLQGERQPWLAIDPRPVSGDPEYAVPELLWTRIDEVRDRQGMNRLLSAVTEEAGLDAQLARSWATVRAVDYWLWGLENGLTEDPLRCSRLLQLIM